MDYTDRENDHLPDETQIKELVEPVMIDFITQIESCISVESLKVLYYHPDLDSLQGEKRWKAMEIPLDHNGPRTKELLDGVELVFVS